MYMYMYTTTHTCICKLCIYNTCTCITDFHSIYEKLIQLCNINEFGTNYSKVSGGLSI